MSLFIIIFAIWDYSYDITQDFTYDNNIFSYSDRYIDDFMQGSHSYKFPFETHDDLILSSKLRLYLRNKIFDRRTTTLNFYVDPNHYIINNEKDFVRFTVGIRQSLGKYAMKFSYQIIPDYLIRFYKNPESSTTQYIGCRVKYHSFTGKMTILAKPSAQFNIYYSYGWDDYVSEFDIYDAYYHEFDISANYGFTERLSTWFGYGLKVLNNDSGLVATSIFEPGPDNSYYRHSLSVELRYETMTIVPTRLSLDYAYNFKNFATEYSVDSLHFGRQDHTHKLSMGIDLKIFTGLYIKTLFAWQRRNATSEISNDLDQLKDYDKYRISAGLSFYH